jgi:hypothetical protein
MKRRSFDMITSLVGLGLAALLLLAGGLLSWTHNFVGNEIHDQLAAQQIYFPPAGSDAIKGSQFAAMQKYAGQQLLTGKQAEVYADHFIAVHLNSIGGGQTYAQLSAKAQADPTNTTLQNQVATVFRGETLRGLLLNAYAFGTMSTIAGIAAVVAYTGGSLLLLLGGLGLLHARRVRADQQVFTGHTDRAPALAH